MTIEYSANEPVRLDTVVVSTQHAPAIDLKALLHARHRGIAWSSPCSPISNWTRPNYRLLVNPTGRFEVGGPMGDAGLTGRKIIIDTYGGMARHGGGAFSGKDPSKVDRSGAYAMRWVAKNVVAAGLADRCETQVAYAIGKAKPVGLFVECFGTEHVPIEQIQDAVLEVFDLRPAAIIRDLELLRPIYAQTASYGHFGRDEPDFSWERTDKIDALRAAVVRTVTAARRGTQAGGARPNWSQPPTCRSRGLPSTSRCRTLTGSSTTWCPSPWPSRPCLAAGSGSASLAG